MDNDDRSLVIFLHEGLVMDIGSIICLKDVVLFKRMQKRFDLFLHFLTVVSFVDKRHLGMDKAVINLILHFKCVAGGQQNDRCNKHNEN